MDELQGLESHLAKYSFEDDIFLSDYSGLSPTVSSLSEASQQLNVGSDEAQAGLIHGHIHNFENFTYIHGHIHTNDDGTHEHQRSSSSNHKHDNDSHSKSFSDCQHFEFLNCHDAPLNTVGGDSLTCNEHENCKPKILEVCCDTQHGPGVPLTSSTVMTDHDHQHHQHTVRNEAEVAEPKEFDFEKALQDCGLGDCIDVKCDLDSCDIDELYCQYCGNMDDQLPSIKMEMDALPESSSQALKRPREDEKALLHHLHHKHHHQNPENHHHHHIQWHDHQQKKAKANDGPELINFEWNFKNQQTKCEWENCSTTLGNSLQLQNHIVETHLLSEYPRLDSNTSTNGGFECEWKNCDYSGFDLFSLVNHINSEHGLPNLTGAFTEHLPTPSETEVKAKPRRGRAQLKDKEQTMCHWIDAGADGQQHQCNQQFESASKLTEHLISDHIGAGQSEYTCLWQGCDRNHRNFNQRQKIIRHLHVHTRYKPYKCEECGHSFAVETMLEQHMRTHSGEKPYQCKQCSKKFATSSSLSIHMRTHTGEKPLACRYPGCAKRFSESSNLTKHMKTHEKTYKCECCSKSFSKEKQLASHMSKYHE